MEAPAIGGARSDEPDEDFAIAILAVAKRCGLSFNEIAELRVKDLFDLIESYLGRVGTRPRRATSADIDRFFV